MKVIKKIETKGHSYWSLGKPEVKEFTVFGLNKTKIVLTNLLQAGG